MTETDLGKCVGCEYFLDGFRQCSRFLVWELKAYDKDKVKGIVYEFNGCYRHGHKCQMPSDPKSNPSKVKVIKERYMLHRKQE